jgi:hypothetical protein
LVWLARGIPPKAPEPVGVDGNCNGPPNDRPPPLEFVHGEIDALAEQSLEGPLQAVPGDQLLQVPVLAAGPAEQGLVLAAGVLMNGPLHEVQEVSLALREATAERRPGLIETDRLLEK